MRWHKGRGLSNNRQLRPAPILFNLRAQAQQHVFAAESVQAAQKTYDIAVVAFQRGLTDYLNVLNALTRRASNSKARMPASRNRPTPISMVRFCIRNLQTSRQSK